MKPAMLAYSRTTEFLVTWGARLTILAGIAFLIAVGLGLAACADSTPKPGEKTPATVLFETKTTYASVLAAVVRYESLPRCTATLKTSCSDTAIVARLRQADNVAAAAIATADAAISAGTGDLKGAVGKASVAVNEYGSVAASFGLGGRS